MFLPGWLYFLPIARDHLNFCFCLVPIGLCSSSSPLCHLAVLTGAQRAIGTSISTCKWWAFLGWTSKEMLKPRQGNLSTKLKLGHHRTGARGLFMSVAPRTQQKPQPSQTHVSGWRCRDDGRRELTGSVCPLSRVKEDHDR